MTRPTAVPYRRARKSKPIAIVRANSMTEAIRRAGMSFIHEPKTAWVARFNWPARGGWKLMPYLAVGPVVEERVGIEQAADLAPGPGLGELLPPLGRHDLAVPIGRLVPGQADVARGGHQGDESDRKDQQRCQLPASSSQPPASRCRSIGSRGSSGIRPPQSLLALRSGRWLRFAGQLKRIHHPRSRHPDLKGHRTPQVIIDRVFAARNLSSLRAPMIRAPDPSVSRSATWVLGLLVADQKSSDMSEPSAYSDEFDGPPSCINAWTWELGAFAAWEVYWVAIVGQIIYPSLRACP